jgi:hypothetical protein
LDADGDRDGVEAVADVVTVDLAAPLVGDVFDGLAVHTPSVEHVFGCVYRCGRTGDQFGPTK